MATTVDTNLIGSVYDALSGKAKDTANALMTANSITETQKAQIISNTIVALIQTSASAALDAPIKEAQVALINAQVNTEGAKKALTERQTDFYEDQLRIEEAKQLATIMMGYAQSGTTIPTDFETTTLNAIAAITPTTTA